MKIEGINRYLLGATFVLGFAAAALGMAAISLRRDVVAVCNPVLARSGWQKAVIAMSDGQHPDQYIAQEQVCLRYGQAQHPTPEESW